MPRAGRRSKLPAGARRTPNFFIWGGSIIEGAAFVNEVSNDRDILARRCSPTSNGDR